MLTEDEKLEYQKIRDEYFLLSQMIATTVNFSVIGSIAIFSFIAASQKSSIWLFGLPLMIVYPGCYIIISRIQSILRLAAYLFVFIEPKGDIKFETRLTNFKSKSKFRFSRTVLWVFLGLILINIGLFISKGFNSLLDVCIYLGSLLLYTHVYYLITRDWKVKFIESWKVIQNVEKTANQKTS